jgi:hypothetical protein
VYDWKRSDKAQRLLANAAALEQAQAATKPLFTGVRQKRKREEELNRDRAEDMVDDCPLHLVEDTVTQALTFFDLCVGIAKVVGAEDFRRAAPQGLQSLLTSIAVAAVPSIGLPVRQGAFLECGHRIMRDYVDAVHINPADWKAKAPASTRFKNSLSRHFTHEALCLPPRVCQVLRDYDIFVAPPPVDSADKFFRSTTGKRLASFAECTRLIMRLWGPRMESAGTGIC